MITYEHHCGFQGPRAAQLADTGLDSVRRSEDQNRPLNAGRLPSGNRLQFCKHGVEALRKIGQNMVVVERKTMLGIKRRSRPAHKHGVG
jgi:hypothetical protein